MQGGREGANRFACPVHSLPFSLVGASLSRGRRPAVFPVLCAPPFRPWSRGRPRRVRAWFSRENHAEIRFPQGLWSLPCPGQKPRPRLGGWAVVPGCLCWSGVKFGGQGAGTNPGNYGKTTHKLRNGRRVAGSPKRGGAGRGTRRRRPRPPRRRDALVRVGRAGESASSGGSDNAATARESDGLRPATRAEHGQGAPDVRLYGTPG